MNLQDVTKAMAGARSTMSEGAFQQAASVLSKNKNNIREKIQKETSSEIKEIINKLAAEKAISTEEINLIKLWIVGDGQSYIKMENNFQDWVKEYERLEKTLASFTSRDCTTSDLFKLQGILEDAVRVSYDIANFLEKKERIQKFTTATSDGLDKGERDTLVRVLTGKLESPSY